MADPQLTEPPPPLPDPARPPAVDRVHPPVEGRLTSEVDDDLEPRAATLATQEVRFAVAFTGGVSLAVWMGGVAREIDLLVQASALRRAPGEPAHAATPDLDPGRRLYRRLLDVVDVQVAADVLAGTSAGGINAALLGLVNTRRLELTKLREVWLEAGALKKLLRPPKEKNPPSILKGDQQLLSALNDGISRILGDADKTPSPRDTDVFITTTYLSPETGKYSDDFGTHITDADHHGLFSFTKADLMSDAGPHQVALAARSSASFPAAFEPSFVPFAAMDDPDHPAMQDVSNATRAHWAADGGLLVNRPLAPLLQTVFDRSSDREVRRALLYVVPSSAPPSDPPADSFSKPAGLAGDLVKDVGAMLNQSISADLNAIKAHNDRTNAVIDTRLRMADLGARLASHGASFVDAAVWADYRVRQGDWIAGQLTAQVMRALDTIPAMPAGWAATPGSAREVTVRSALLSAVTAQWPGDPHADVLATAAALGRPALDAGKATALRLLRLGYQATADRHARNQLSKLSTDVHASAGTTGPSPWATMVRGELRGVTPDSQLVATMKAIGDAYTASQGKLADLRADWTALGETIVKALPLLESIAGGIALAPPAPVSRTPGQRSVDDQRQQAVRELTTYLDYLRHGQGPTRALVDLHIATRSLLPIHAEIEQRVELIQVSADTRTLLDQKRVSAEQKLTGMQFHHFGAFYKKSWRANDWMWGRLDGCGWLVHILLDPQRIRAVMERSHPEKRAEQFRASLSKALEIDIPADVEDLSFLDDDARPVPPSLPNLAVHVAQAWQRHIAFEELTCVADQLRSGEDTRTAGENAWLEAVDKGGLTDPAHMLQSCPVPDEKLSQQSGQPLFLTTVSQALAVMTAAATAMKDPPASMQPVFNSARTLTRTAAAVVARLQGRRNRLLIAGVAALVVGVVLLRYTSLWSGVSGFALLAVGVLLVAFATEKVWVPRIKLICALLFAVAVVVLALTPWLHWLDKRVFSWLTRTAIPWIQSHDWSWPVLLLLVLLPPITTVLGLAKCAAGGKKKVPQASP